MGIVASEPVAQLTPSAAMLDAELTPATPNEILRGASVCVYEYVLPGVCVMADPHPMSPPSRLCPLPSCPSSLAYVKLRALSRDTGTFCLRVEDLCGSVVQCDVV